MNRRTFLSSLGIIAATSVAGCSSSSNEEPPAGSLRFENRHNLPHLIKLTVTGVGTEPTVPTDDTDAPLVTGDVPVEPSELGLTTTTSLAPSETQTFENVFTEPVWYGVEFTFDGRSSEKSRTAYHPAPPERERGRVLAGVVKDSGQGTWEKSGTDDRGAFTERETE